jgi:hypothetical protein
MGGLKKVMGITLLISSSGIPPSGFFSKDEY